MNKPIRIAIDGPVGSGKGTLAIALAKKLNAFYVYTGAMYRCLGIACLREKIDIKNEDEVVKVFGEISIELKEVNGETRVLLNSEDVTNEVFGPNAAMAASDVGIFPRVRREMVSRQKKMVEETVNNGKSVVMEGRDIATDVIPNADMKIYLTADVKKRAERRLRQFTDKGIKLSFDEVLKEVEERDKQDTEREASPLKIAKGSTVIDTTNDTINQTVDKVIEKLKVKKLI